MKELCDLYNDKALKLSKYDYIDYSVSEKINENDENIG